MKKDSKENQAKYVELNLFPEEIEDHQKDSVSSDSKENHTSSDKEYDLTDLFERLSGSAFRSRFHLSKKERTELTNLVMNRKIEWGVIFDLFQRKGVSVDNLLMGPDFFQIVRECWPV